MQCQIYFSYDLVSCLYNVFVEKLRLARSTCSLLNAIIKSRYYKVHFLKRIKLKRFAKNEEAGFLTRIVVARWRLRYIDLGRDEFSCRFTPSFHPLHSSFFFLLPLRRICLGLISTSRRAVTICLREGWRTLGHKFPSCSKPNRVELIHFLSF